MIPHALINSKASFLPYQYGPFNKVFKKGKDELNGNNLLITDEVGVGKTFEAGIIISEILKSNPYAKILIIAPVKLCANWKKELSEFFDQNFNNYRETKFIGDEYLNIVPYSYFSSGVKKESSQPNDEQDDIAEENQFLENNNNSGLTDEQLNKLEQLNYDILILDEAHYIRNGGKLYQCIDMLVKNNEASESKLKIFMTATPVFNKDSDYENLASLLTHNNQKFATTTTLQAEANCYDTLMDISVINVKLSDNEQEIISEINNAKYAKLRGFLKRISTSSIHSLKCFIEKYQSNVNLNIEDEVDGEILEDEMDNFEGIDFTNLDSLIRKISIDSKLEELKKKIIKIENNPNTKNNSKETKGIVIFATFINTCNYLKEKLSDNYTNVFTITGQTNFKELQTIKSDFQQAVESGETAILICSDAAKEGHNFQFCQNLIHYDFPYTPAAMSQRSGRIYRTGQKGEPKIYYMNVLDSYDQRLFGQIIMEKINIVKGLSNGDKISCLNILPSDSGDYLKNCLGAYFDHKVDLQETDKKDTEEVWNSPEEKVFKCELRRKFSNMEDGKRIWIDDIAKDLHEKSNDIDYREKYVEIFSEKLASNEELGEYYKDNYNKKCQELNKQFFGSNTQNSIQENIEQAKQKRGK